MSNVCEVDDNNNNDDGTSVCDLNHLHNCGKLKDYSFSINKLKREQCDTQPIDLPNLNSKPIEKASTYPSIDQGEDVKKLDEIDINQQSISDNFSDDNKENFVRKDSNQKSGKDGKSFPVKIQKSQNLRGILKYPPGWRRRAISESSAFPCSLSSFSDDTAYFGTSLDSPDLLFELEDEVCLDDSTDTDKPKKCVTFSDKMATFLFRPNSSILGRRLKNQKRAKRKKEKRLRDSLNSLENSPKENDFLSKVSDDIEATRIFIAMQRFNYENDCSSVSDVTSSSGCETSASECSGDEATIESKLNQYESESKSGNNKSKRKNRRRRNRKNKQNVRTTLETGGYDSDY